MMPSQLPPTINGLFTFSITLQKEVYV
jgi:hypothetical protein